MEWQISNFGYYGDRPATETFEVGGWSELAEFAAYPEADAEPDPDKGKLRLPCWSPATFRGSRSKANVTSISALVLDYDHDTTIAEAEALWEPYFRVVHTSYKHGKDGADRFRVVLPLAQPVSPDEHRALWDWAFSHSPTIDRACKDVSRVYFVPAVGRFAEPYSKVHEGPFLDFGALDIAKPKKPTKSLGVVGMDERTRAAYVSAWRDRVTLLIEPLRTIEDGRHEAYLKTATLLSGYLYLDHNLENELTERLTEVAEALGRNLPDTLRAIEDGINNGKDRPLPLNTLGAELDTEDEEPGPLIVLPDDGTGAYVRTSDGAYVFVRGTAAMRTRMRERGDISMNNAKGKPYTYDQFCDMHNAVPLSAVHYTHDASKAGFDPSTAILTICENQPECEPREHPEVARWLTAMVKQNTPSERALFFDWLANAYNFEHPIAALYLYGPKGCGKSMLASGLASPWGRGAVPTESAFAAFNAELLGCPIVNIDEGSDQIPTTDLRRMISATEHKIRRKYQNEVTLISCLRIIVGANNPTALRLDRINSAGDLDAIAERVLYLRLGRGGSDFLESNGNRALTNGWVTSADGKAGKIAEHVAWLAGKANQNPTDRYLVSGPKDSEFRYNLVLCVNSTSEVVYAILEALKQRAGRETVSLLPDGDVSVNVSNLLREWSRVGSGTRSPGASAVTNALTAIAKSEPVGGKFVIDGALIRRATAIAGTAPKTEPVKADANVAV